MNRTFRLLSLLTLAITTANAQVQIRPADFFASYSGDGAWLLFSAQDAPKSPVYRVFVVMTDGSHRRQLGDSTRSNEGPRWSRDSRRVLATEVSVLESRPGEAMRDFAKRRDAAEQYYSVLPDNSGRQSVGKDDFDTLRFHPEVSRDGKWRAFTKSVDGKSGLYVKDVITGAEHRLVGN